MIKILIPDKAAIQEIQDMYNLSRYCRSTRIYKAVIDANLELDDEIVLELHHSLIAKSFAKNTRLLEKSLGKLLTCHVTVNKRGDLIHIFAGYMPRPKNFAKEVNCKLAKRDIRSIEFRKRDCPKAYMEQPFHFLNRIRKATGFFVRWIDLGDTVRIVKLKKNPKRCKPILDPKPEPKVPTLRLYPDPTKHPKAYEKIPI